jgi:hypothetical protein
MFRGYMDESYNAQELKFFTLSCLMATGKDWAEMERVWRLQLTTKNKQLAKEGRRPISRYHATDCNGRRKEFAGWTKEERDEFVIKLFCIFRRVPLNATAYDVNLDDLVEVFPEWGTDKLEAAYYALTKFVMYTIGDDFDKWGRGHAHIRGKPVRVTLFHDRTANGRYDSTILRAFNQQIHAANSDCAKYFTTIAPKAWQDCIALQPADLVAFEIFKDMQARADARKRRQSFSALIDMAAFGIHTKSFTRETLTLMRQDLERRGIIGELAFNLRK